MQKEKKVGLGVIFSFLIFNIAIFWLAFPANFEPAGASAAAVMGVISLLFWGLATHICISPDKQIARYIHRITRDLAACSVLLVIAYHFSPAAMFSSIGAGIVFLTGLTLTAEYQRFIRVGA